EGLVLVVELPLGDEGDGQRGEGGLGGGVDRDAGLARLLGGVRRGDGQARRQRQGGDREGPVGAGRARNFERDRRAIAVDDLDRRARRLDRDGTGRRGGGGQAGLPQDGGRHVPLLGEDDRLRGRLDDHRGRLPLADDVQRRGPEGRVGRRGEGQG